VNFWLPQSMGLGPAAHDRQEQVTFLFCTKCHPNEAYPTVMSDADVDTPENIRKLY